MTAPGAHASLGSTRPPAAHVVLAACGAFVALLGLLHVIKPEIDPGSRFISEYALGAHGWLMNAAFFALALAYTALASALRAELRTRSGRVGFALLLVSALGLLLAGLFTTDPITTSHQDASVSGMLHNLGGALGMAMPFAAGAIAWALRQSPAWRAHRRAIGLSALGAIAGFVLSIVWIGASLAQSDGAFGPDVLVGWPNRIEIALYCAWLWVVARAAARVTLQG